MNFDQQETQRQLAWKKSIWPHLAPGTRYGRSYDHILPTHHWYKNIYPPILWHLME